MRVLAAEASKWKLDEFPPSFTPSWHSSWWRVWFSVQVSSCFGDTWTHPRQQESRKIRKARHHWIRYAHSVTEAAAEISMLTICNVRKQSGQTTLTALCCRGFVVEEAFGQNSGEKSSIFYWKSKFLKEEKVVKLSERLKSGGKQESGFTRWLYKHLAQRNQ